MSEPKEMLGVFPFVVSGLSYVPFIGLVFGVIVIIWGLTTKKHGGATLAWVGAYGVGLTAILFSATAYITLVDGEGFMDEARTEVTGNSLASLVSEIEFYRIQHGKYPESLEALALTLPAMSQGLIYDPATLLVSDEPGLFYYERTGKNHYYLLASGPDGEPFTEDDKNPDVAITPQSQTGLLIKGTSPVLTGKDIFEYFHPGKNITSAALLDSAFNGNADSMAMIGWFHEHGHGGFIKSDAKAAEWYGKAVLLENPYAKGKLGIMYLNGRGVEKNLDAAFKLVSEAAEAGDSAAQNELGVMYKTGVGAAVNLVKAAEWYQRSADQGVATAKYNLAHMYANGLGVEKDAEKAMHYYKLAAYAGDLDAHNDLGLMYRLGELGDEDIDKAIYYLAPAAGLGHARSQINLGAMYLYGEGKLPVNREKALYLFRLAAEQGDEAAIEILNDLTDNEASI